MDNYTLLPVLLSNIIFYISACACIMSNFKLERRIFQLETEKHFIKDKLNNQNALLETIIFNKSVLKDIDIYSLKFYINSGFDIDMKDKNGKNLLHYHYKNLNMLRELIKYGADVNIKDNTGHAIFHNSIITNKEFLDIILTTNVDLNLKDVSGTTILQYAIASPDTFKRLVDAGADINVKDNTGLTIRQRIQYYYGSSEETNKMFEDSNTI
jgi:ankyrin repeat protein